MTKFDLKLMCTWLSFQAAQLHRIYDREVVELDENVSFLIVFPPPEDVCSAPGQMDSFSNKKTYISLPVQTFEMSKLHSQKGDFSSVGCEVRDNNIHSDNTADIKGNDKKKLITVYIDDDADE